METRECLFDLERYDFLENRIARSRRTSRRCDLLAHGPVVSAIFDEPNLVSAAGVVPMLGLAATAGPHALAATWLSVPTDKRANAGINVASLIDGVIADADPARYDHAAIHAALAGGAEVSATVQVKRE